MAMTAFACSPLAGNIRHVERVVIIGKGPSSDRVKAELKFNGTQAVIALNDAYRLTPLFSAVHFTDYEAAKRADFKIRYRAVICPAFPHVDNKPRPDMPAYKMIEDCPVVKRAHDDDMFYCYPGSTAKGKAFSGPGRTPAGPVINVRLFSAVTVTDLVIMSKARSIHYIGVDEGQGYGKAFQDLTPLTNGRASFDGQLALIRRMANAAKVPITFARKP